MDEAFWANVVKRWSQASDNVLKLKEELARLQSERFLYAPQRRSLSQIPIRDFTQNIYESGRKEATDELLDAEAGLSRAKEEYRRLQQELAASAERIRALNLENEVLLANQRDLTKIRKEVEQLRLVQHDLDILRSDNKSHLEKIRDLERQQQSNREASIPCAEQQIETLRQSMKAQDEDNQRLRGELRVTQEKLQKSEETKDVLVSSIVKLQDIARHSTTATLHPRSADLSLSSACRSNLEALSDSPAKQIPVESSIGRLPNQTDDITFVERMAAESSFLSFKRQRAVAALPPVVCSVTDRHLTNTFDREFLKIALGKSLASRLDSNSQSIASYLCPTLNHHPWCPSRTGDHGFIFVGLGKDKDSYHPSAIRHLFIGLPKTGMESRRFRYLGKYKATRADPLSVDEWATLSADFKSMYVKLTKDKTKDARTLEDIRAAHDNGDICVPCVQLQCIGFDDTFFTALLSERDAESPVS